MNPASKPEYSLQQHAFRHFVLENKITEYLRDVRILLSLYLWNDPRIWRYFINDKRKLQPTNMKKKGPVEVSGRPLKMNKEWLSSELLSTLKKEEWLNGQEKKAYEECINQALSQELRIPYIATMRENPNIKAIHTHFYSLYKNGLKTELAKRKDSNQRIKSEKEIPFHNMRDVSIVIAIILFQKNPNFIGEKGDVSEEWCKYLQDVCRKVLQDPTAFGSKSASTILHDGDFGFLTTSNKTPLFEHFVQFILYLMDEKCYNAYTNNNEGPRKRKKAKYALLNDIYMFITNVDLSTPKTIGGEAPESYSDMMHKNTIKLFEPKIEELNASNKTNPNYTWEVWKFSARKKTVISRRRKESKIPDGFITDDSGVRATRYGEKNEDNQQLRNENTIVLFEKYLQTKEKQGKTNLSLEFSKKNWFIDEKTFEIIVEKAKKKFPQAQIREKSSQSLDELFEKYEQQYNERLSPEAKKAYQIAVGVGRGVYWAYTDVKCVGKWVWSNWNEIECEEFSVYDRENEVGLSHTAFYAVWKEIFDNIYKRRDASLNKLRYKIETAIKTRSYELDIEEENQKNWKYPAPNDDYQYMEVDGWESVNTFIDKTLLKNLDAKELEKAQIVLKDFQEAVRELVSLKGLLYRDKDNDEIFDKIVCQIINTWLKENKIMFLNPPLWDKCRFITPKDLKNPHTFSSIRFITSEVLESLSIDPRYLRTHSIGMYDPELNRFSECILWDIGRLSTLLGRDKTEIDNYEES